MPPYVPFLIAAAVILVAVGAYFAWKAEKERREALARLAQKLGFRFRPGHDTSHDDR